LRREGLRISLNHILKGGEMARRIFQIKYHPGEELALHFRRPRIFDAERHREEEEVVVRSRLPRIRFRPFIDAGIDFIDAGIEPIERREREEKKGEGKTKIDIEGE
jgi:hypothetical protein